ncbi:hypothetical protein F4778DRAFT_731490 [Xylariomycetidae sp. FL2044]|nr:hypothetical protein F4778DRAFT_731490 [Xylariomycetidae sp. FL2044]
MSMFRQYQSLRRAVQDDLAKCQQPGLSKTDATPGTSTPNSSDEKKSENLPAGVTISRPEEGDGAVTFLVGWKDGDPLNPQNWTRAKKWRSTALVCLIAIAVCIPGTIDAPVSGQFNEHYDVGPIAGSLTTGTAPPNR